MKTQLLISSFFFVDAVGLSFFLLQARRQQLRGERRAHSDLQRHFIHNFCHFILLCSNCSNLIITSAIDIMSFSYIFSLHFILLTSKCPLVRINKVL